MGKNRPGGQNLVYVLDVLQDLGRLNSEEGPNFLFAVSA
jgi:hypothetical protein